MYADTIILYYTSHFIIFGKKIGGGGAQNLSLPQASATLATPFNITIKVVYTSTLIRLYSKILVILLFLKKNWGGGGAQNLTLHQQPSPRHCSSVVTCQSVTFMYYCHFFFVNMLYV